MLDHMIIIFTETKVGWAVVGMIGAIASVFIVYYISFAIYLIVASLYSGIKLLPESYGIWKEELAETYGPAWGGAELGVTMPDGGEPIDEEEEEKEV